MGNIFSDCFEGRKTQSQGHRLGNNNNTTSIGSSTSAKEVKTSGGHTLNGSDNATGGGGPSREDMLAAAQKRQDDARSKGVQKGGGKLSNQLEEQRKNPVQPDSIPSDSNLQWRAD